jgi:opacity protein-like surface antigen
MTKFKWLTMAIVTAVSTPAFAADLPPMLRPQPVHVEEFGSGWYLRGDIGMSAQRVDRLENALFPTAVALTFLDEGGFEGAPFGGVGLGYRLNSWLRFDATIEYRAKAGFHALDRFDNGGTPNSNDYTGTKSEWVGLVNAYVDIGTWGGVTPFIGAGVGFSRNTISHFRDLNVVTDTLAYGEETSKTELAWAVYAGLAYRISSNATVEFAYRYLHLGDAESGDLIAFGGANAVYNPMIFREITSHDFKLGLRYEFSEPRPAFGPLQTKG